MEESHRASAESIRSLISRARATPAVFRAAFVAVPPADRDTWVDCVLELDEVPDDGPALPPGGVPYWPCPVAALLELVDEAGLDGTDVFVDVGSGVGRAATLVHLLTGAAAIGLEVQPALVAASRALATRLDLSRVSTIEGDAASLAGFIVIGTVFFLYCPFSGERLQKVLDELAPLARTRPLRVCCVHLPLPPCAWLTPASPSAGALTVYRSTARSQDALALLANGGQ